MKAIFKFKLCLFLILFTIILVIYFSISNSLKKDITIVDKEVIINEISNINKLIPLEVELSHSIIISDNHIDSELFNKSKQLTFFADCSYSIDLSNIDSSNIVFDNNLNEVIITVPNPDIFSISINEEKTQFSETEIGFFRFGDLEISSEEFVIILNRVKESFAEKMNDASLKSLAIENTKESIEALLLEITKETFEVTLKVENN